MSRTREKFPLDSLMQRTTWSVHSAGVPTMIGMRPLPRSTRLSTRVDALVVGNEENSPVLPIGTGPGGDHPGMWRPALPAPRRRRNRLRKFGAKG